MLILTSRISFSIVQLKNLYAIEFLESYPLLVMGKARIHSDETTCKVLSITSGEKLVMGKTLEISDETSCAIYTFICHDLSSPFYQK